jgi:hypothetical protein
MQRTNHIAGSPAGGLFLDRCSGDDFENCDRMSSQRSGVLQGVAVGCMPESACAKGQAVKDPASNG